MLFRQLIQAAAFTAATASAASSDPTTDEIKKFDWSSIDPSRDLEYHDCYHGFKCARLTVPLDWRNASDGRTVAIAMVKLPAVVADDDPTFGGSIFLNPGGPGGSGVIYAVNTAVNVQKILVDIPGVRHYEIVSFDPRGIGRTTPITDCFLSNQFARTAWTLENHAKGPLGSGPAAVGYGLGITRSFSVRCKEEEKQFGEEGAMMFVNTPSVARDMVEMVDKIDQLRKREAAEKQQKPEQKPQQKPQQKLQAQVDDSQKEEGEVQVKEGKETQQELKKRGNEDENDPVPRLQYIGFSYGTILGNYFASMFPGRVGRIVLDGVMDAMDYATGPVSENPP